MFIRNKKIKIFDSDALNYFHKRIFFSIIIFTLCYFVAIFRIADVMIFDKSTKNYTQVVKNIDRGKIYDRYGQLLSTNVNSYSLFVNSKKIKNKNIISKKISEIINIDSKLIYKKLNLDKNFVYLKRNISPQEYKKILELGEINLQTHLETKRVYPYQNIGSHIIGYVDIDNNGKAGIERGFDDILNSGEDLFLTININLQSAIRQELIDTVKKYSAESASVIIMDIENAEILSLNNFPDFDPNNISKSNLNQRLNRALQSNYEMGSTFKPLTIAMGIEDGIIKKDMKFDVSKPIKNTIRDWEPCICILGVKDIIVKSSNIGTAKIAKMIGKETQVKFFKKFGFYDPVKIKLAEAAKPFGQPYNWGEMETMTIGFGHGFAITPLHLAVAYNAILNQGKKISPKIILGEKKGKHTRVIKKETSDYISTLLRAVIEETDYTGPRVKIEGYDIGGTTGTAEMLNENGRYDKNLNRTIFIGAFPMYNPKYLILTFIDKPKRRKSSDSITSATVNAPLVKNIIIKMIEILKLPKKQQNSILNIASSVDYKNTNVLN